MTSIPDNDWRKAIARILNANTGDLRALAALAGADPRTLYIGTRLDGVDVRGQDLRGMNLEGVDRSKIRYDEETRFDYPSEALPLIYLSEFDVDPSSLQRLSQWTPFIIAEREAGAFISAAATHAGPVFIIAWGLPSRKVVETAQALSAAGAEYLLVIIDDARSLRKRAELLGALLPLREPSLSVPSSGAFLGVRNNVITPESRDAMSVVADHWADRETLFNGEDSWFVRARGLGHEPQVDAAAQIFDRLAGFSLSAKETVLVIPKRASDKKDKQLIEFPALRLLDGKFILPGSTRASRDDFHLAAFGKFVHQRDRSQYIISTMNTLSARRPGRKDSLDVAPFIVGSRSQRLKIEYVRDPNFSSRKALYADPDFDLSQIGSVVLSESAGIGTVVDRLVSSRELWVTSRDLLALPADGMSVRLIVAAQLRRVVRTIPGRAVRGYLELMLRQSVRDGAFLVDDESGWLLQALEHGDFSDRYHLALSKLSIRPYGSTGRLRISSVGASKSLMGSTSLDLQLTIDSDVVEIRSRGPWMSKVNRGQES